MEKNIFGYLLIINLLKLIRMKHPCIIIFHSEGVPILRKRGATRSLTHADTKFNTQIIN
jgi:hypothetical protein